jgi:hypothetical protein
VKTTFLFTSWMHLGDEALTGAALYQPAARQRDGETPLLSPGQRAHLAECPRCLGRLEDVRIALGSQRRDMETLADARFPQSRLEAQRTSILARIAERHAGARVLMFPSALAPAAAAPLPESHRPSFRVIAASVAAGLFLALMTAQTLYVREQVVRQAATQAERDRIPHIPRYHVRWKAESGPDAQPGDEADDRLFGEIETLARGRRNPALRAIDDLTPRASNDPRSRRYRER